MKTILLKDLKPDYRIIVPPQGGEPERYAEVLSVEGDYILVELYGNDRDDDNLMMLSVRELPEYLETWE